MEPWVKLSIWIGAFGFFKEFRPEDPYITQYLTGPMMNFTDTEVNQVIFPVATYTSLCELVFVFLITDWLRYKPVVILCALSGVVTQAILIWCQGLTWVVICEIFYGTMSSCEVAYYAYIYAKVEPEHFQQVTSHMRTAVLCGRFLSSVVSQVLLAYDVMTIYELNHLTLFGMSTALLWGIFLPSVPRSIYFHRDEPAVSVENGTYASSAKPVQNGGQYQNQNGDAYQKTDVIQASSKCSNACRYIWDDFKFAFTNGYVIKWSLWVALGTCGYLQIMSYVQILWETINKESGENNWTIYNGAVEAVYTLISATAAFTVGRVKANWELHGEFLLGILTFIEGVLAIIVAHSKSMWVAYGMYISFSAFYHIMMTVAFSEIAKHIKPDSYALVFGVNSFVGLVIQTLLTYLVTSDEVFSLPIRPQFVVYGIFFSSLGILYLIKSFFTYSRHYCCSSERKDPDS